MLQALHDAGFQVETTPQTAQFTLVIPRLLPILMANHNLLPALLRLLSNAALRKGNAYTRDQLQQIAQPAAHTAHFDDALHALLAAYLLERGYNVTCPHCHLTHWLTLSQIIQHETHCPFCQQTRPLPLNLTFAYRLNPLLAVTLKMGILTVALTLDAVQADADSWYASLIVKRGDIHTDMDLLLTRDNKLWLIECKDNIRHDESSLSALLAQLRIGKVIADEIDAHYSFATLTETDHLPRALNEYAISHNLTFWDRQRLINP